MATRGKSKQRLSMKGQIHKAYKVLLKLISPKHVTSDKSIPLNVLKNAKGVCFLTTLKAGFVFTGSAGCGIVIARLEDGSWSGPSSVGAAGMGWGLQIGASSVDSVIILNTKAAVKAFSGKANVKFGGNLSIAAGPVGRDADAAVNAGDGGVASCYSYSHTRGAFAGLALNGQVLVARDSDNAKFYGQKCTTTAILSGIIKPPQNEDLELLYKTLRIITHSETPEFEYRDSVTGSMRDFDGSETDASMYGRPSYFEEDSQDLGPVTEAANGDDEWEELKTPEGKVYYHNKKTGQTAWEKPAAVPPLAVPVAAPTIPVGSLPPNWKELQTEDGKVYYFNIVENITQWEKPVATPPQQPVSQVSQPGAVYQPPQPVPYQAPQPVPYQAPQPVPYQAPQPVPYQAPQPAVVQQSHQAELSRATSQQQDHQAELARAMSSRLNVSAQQPLSPPVLGQNHVATDEQDELTKRLSARRVPPLPTGSNRPAAPLPSTATTTPSEAPSQVSAPLRNGPAPLPSEAEAKYTYTEVCARGIPGMDVTKLEMYLNDAEFKRIFKTDRESFQKLPKWKRDRMKKDVDLF